MTGSLDRRGFLTIGAAGAAGFLVAGCSSDDDVATANSTTTTASTTTAAAGSGGGTATTVASGSAVGTELTAADFASLGTCLLMTEKTAGPFPLDEQFDRRDITEGSEGHPLRLGLRVLDEGCAAISGAKVEIWHCDALGSYSGFESASASANAPQNLRGAAGAGTQAGPGGTGGGGAGGGGAARTDDETYLRGAQVTDANGVVEFLTVYPGWYTGRAVHVHLKVHLGGTTALTSQLYFPDDVNDRAHAVAPYATHAGSRTTNDVDLIFHADNQSAVAETTEGWAAALTIGLTT